MNEFHTKQGRLFCEDVDLATLAEAHGTPLYVYSQSAFVKQIQALQRAFAEVDPLICYSVKANSNLSILRMLADLGSGFDVVSEGEFFRVVKAGGTPDKTVFAGVGKIDQEIENALRRGVLMFNVESEEELDAIADVAARLEVKAPIALRVNPDVDPKTHRYISTGKKESKFGMDIDRALNVAAQTLKKPSLSMIGMHMHIGSQITSIEPYAAAVDKGVALVKSLREQGHPIHWYNMGGGFGIDYQGGEARPIEEFAKVIVPGVKSLDCRLALEPGRVVAGNSGVLISRVIYTKKSGEKRFLIQDAAMNDLIRPSLYDSFHRIWPVIEPSPDNAKLEPWDVVGPVCESGDFLAKDRELPPLKRGDLIAVFSAGAYGMVMASNYNTRPRAAEILVNGASAKLIRRRETLQDLIQPEEI